MMVGFGYLILLLLSSCLLNRFAFFLLLIIKKVWKCSLLCIARIITKIAEMKLRYNSNVNHINNERHMHHACFWRNYQINSMCTFWANQATKPIIVLYLLYVGFLERFLFGCSSASGFWKEKRGEKEHPFVGDFFT
jgi:hypothetical protein